MDGVPYNEGRMLPLAIYDEMMEDHYNHPLGLIPMNYKAKIIMVSTFISQEKLKSFFLLALLVITTRILFNTL